MQKKNAVQYQFNNIQNLKKTIIYNGDNYNENYFSADNFGGMIQQDNKYMIDICKILFDFCKK